jgi:pilus assembly protein CpaB
MAAEIGEGFRAYTIKVSDVTGVGGHALPGDRVDVVLMRDTTPEGPGHNFVSEVVLQNVRVLGVDLNADLASNKPANPSTATLEVTVPDAQKLSVAGDLGKLSLALRKTGSTEVAQTGPLRGASFVGGGGAPRAVAHRGTAAAPEAPRLIVIVADETKGGHAARAPKKAPEPDSPTPPPPPAPAAMNSASRPS